MKSFWATFIDIWQLFTGHTAIMLNSNPLPENTRLLRKGKYHCTADLLFDWFRFSCFVELKL